MLVCCICGAFSRIIFTLRMTIETYCTITFRSLILCQRGDRWPHKTRLHLLEPLVFSLEDATEGGKKKTCCAIIFVFFLVDRLMNSPMYMAIHEAVFITCCPKLASGKSLFSPFVRYIFTENKENITNLANLESDCDVQKKHSCSFFDLQICSFLLLNYQRCRVAWRTMTTSTLTFRGQTWGRSSAGSLQSRRVDVGGAGLRRASLNVECGSPGNPKGVHQSGSGAAEASGNTPGAQRRVEIRWWEMLRECGGGKGEGETIASGVGRAGLREWNASPSSCPRPLLPSAASRGPHV